MKRILGIIMATLMVVMLLPLGGFAVTAQEYSVVEINNEDEFITLFANTVREYYTNNQKPYGDCIVSIKADLDFTDETDLEWANEIGFAQTFSGIIDGNGHTIKGLKYYASDISGESTSVKYTGLLGGKIKAGSSPQSQYDNACAGVFNLALIDCEINTDGNYAGALFGCVDSGDGAVIFKNVYIDVDITSTKSYVGGFAGYNLNSKLDIQSCAFAGDITAAASSQIGGFIGGNGITKNLPTTLNISNCGFYGSVEGSSGVGVFTGVNGNSNDTVLNIQNVIVVGGISGSDDVSVLAGANKSDKAVNSKSIVISQSFRGADISDASIYTAVSDASLIGMDATGLPSEFVALPEGYAVPNGVVNFLRYKWTEDGRTQKSTSYVGYQMVADGDIQIRLSAVLNDGAEGASLDGFGAVGFDVTITRSLSDGMFRSWSNKENGEAPLISAVYRSAIYGKENQIKSAEELGGDYIFVASICGIREKSGELAITVRTFHCDADGTKVYGDVAVIMLDTGKAEVG